MLLASIFKVGQYFHSFSLLVIARSQIEFVGYLLARRSQIYYPFCCVNYFACKILNND